LFNESGDAWFTIPWPDMSTKMTDWADGERKKGQA
jgi:hypothetical protein